MREHKGKAIDIKGKAGKSNRHKGKAIDMISRSLIKQTSWFVM
jgi:hypothetical protein